MIILYYPLLKKLAASDYDLHPDEHEVRLILIYD